MQFQLSLLDPTLVIFMSCCSHLLDHHLPLLFISSLMLTFEEHHETCVVACDHTSSLICVRRISALYEDAMEEYSRIRWQTLADPKLGVRQYQRGSGLLAPTVPLEKMRCDSLANHRIITQNGHDIVKEGSHLTLSLIGS